MYNNLSHYRTDAHVVTSVNSGFYTGPTGSASWLAVPNIFGQPTYVVPKGRIAVTTPEGLILDPSGVGSWGNKYPVIKFVVGSGSDKYIFSSSKIHKRGVTSVTADCATNGVGQISDVLFNCIECDKVYTLNIYMTSPLLEEEFGNTPLVNHNLVKAPCCNCGSGCDTTVDCCFVMEKLVASINDPADKHNNFVRAEVIYGNYYTYCLAAGETVSKIDLDGTTLTLDASYDPGTETAAFINAVLTALAALDDPTIKLSVSVEVNADGTVTVILNTNQGDAQEDVTLTTSGSGGDACDFTQPLISASVDCTGETETTYKCGIRIKGMNTTQLYQCCGLSANRLDSNMDVLKFSVQTQSAIDSVVGFGCDIKVVSVRPPSVAKGSGRRLWYEQKSANRDTINPITGRAVTFEIPAPEQDLGVFNVNCDSKYCVITIMHENNAPYTHGIDTPEVGHISTLIGIPSDHATTKAAVTAFLNAYFGLSEEVTCCVVEDSVTSLYNGDLEFTGGPTLNLGL